MYFPIMHYFLDSSTSSCSPTIRAFYIVRTVLYFTPDRLSSLSALSWPRHALRRGFKRPIAARTVSLLLIPRSDSFSWFSNVDAFCRRYPPGNWLTRDGDLAPSYTLKHLWLVRDRCVLPFAGCSATLSSRPATNTTRMWVLCEESPVSRRLRFRLFYLIWPACY